jgi:hypothetical protein
MSTLGSILNRDLGVKETYSHGPKRVTPGDPIELMGAILKWYRLYSDDRGEVSSGAANSTNSSGVTVEIEQGNTGSAMDEIDRLARSYLMNATLEAKGLGFVILHRCANEFYFLIVNTWRGNNELWETVFYKDGPAMPDFALWPRDHVHKPAFCVWELMSVWHETKSWERFLLSTRDEAAARVWLQDLYAGDA